MNYFLKANRNLFLYSLIVLLVISTFGINFFMSFLSNVLLIIFLIPILFLLLALVGFISFKSQINKCSDCGGISLGLSESCIYCGADLRSDNKKNRLEKKPSESTIEVKAEEIK